MRHRRPARELTSSPENKPWKLISDKMDKMDVIPPSNIFFVLVPRENAENESC
jgi:hypothetical protein